MDSCSVKPNFSLRKLKELATQNLKSTATMAEPHGVNEPTVRIIENILNSTTGKQKKGLNERSEK
jgi:hypothetical protein